MRFTSLFFQKAPVEVFDQVGAAPIELRGNGRHEGGHESGKENSQERVRRLARSYEHETAFGLSQIGIQDNRDQSRQNPGPRTQRVVRKVEPQDGKQTVAFVLRAEDALRDISSAAWFRARIPEGPPLHGQVNDEGDDRQRPKSFAADPARKIRQECRDVTRAGPNSSATLRELRQELGHSSDGADTVPSHANYDGHFQNKLEQISPENAPQAAQ